MGSHHANRRAADTAISEGVGWDLLFSEISDEVCNPSPSAETLLRALSGREQRNDCVEICISPPSRITSA